MDIIKNIKKNTILLSLITIIVLVIVLHNDFNSIINSLQKMDYKFVLLAILLFFFSMFLKSYVNYITVNDKNKITKKEAFKHQIITQFFNGITPFSSGGQPMEIYMLTEHNISLAKSTNITLQCFIFYQVALVICGLIAVLYNFFFHIFPEVDLLKKLVFIGFLVNLLVALFLLLVTKSKRTTKKICFGIIKVLRKLKIIKREDIEEKVNEKIEEFSNCSKEIKERKWLFTKCVILNILSLGFIYIIPLILMFALHDTTSMNVADVLTSSAYVYIIGAFVPLPGASGGIEYSFLRFYGNFLKNNILTTILIIWRFITYYLGVILGAILFNIEKKGD